MFSAASIVWDREFGFLREMLVAPVSRASLVLGKCLGGATAATSQGVLVIALAGLVDVPYEPSLILIVFVMQALLAYTLTAFGVMIAARVKQIQSFMAVTQMLIMPLFFISGAMFPLSGLPTWLTVLNRLDPLTYAVEPMRHAVFDRLNLDPVVRARLDPGVTWGGWQVPPVMCALVVVALGVLLTAVAIAEFRKIE
jgi:ABC-2 type transport system permease protein